MNNLKRIIFILGIIILTLFTFTTKVNAGREENQTAFYGNTYSNVGTNIEISRKKSPSSDVLFTLNSRGAYCIQDGVHARDGAYHVHYYIEIDGNVATRKTRTGAVYNSWTSDANSYFTYILNEGNYRKSGYIYDTNDLKNATEKNYNKDDYTVGVRNRAIWKYIPTWMDGVIAHLGVDKNWKHSEIKAPDHTLQKEADTFVKNADYMLPTIATSYSTFSESTSNTNIMGPFKVTFIGSLDLHAYDSAGSELTNLTFYSDNTGTNAIEKSSIESGVEFYIKSNTTSKINKVDVKANGKKRSARIWLIRATEGNHQDMMITQCWSADTSSNPITINYKSITGNLKLTKKDLYSGDVIKDAEFEFWETTSRQSLSGTNGNYILGSTRQKYKTDANGVINLTGIPVGTYEIYERSAPGYIVKQQKTTYYSDSWGSLMGSVTVTSGGNATKTIYNKKLRQFKID